MSNNYEETMPILTNKDEYLKYYIDESLPMFDKLNIIMKKGQPFQREALITNLNAYVNDSLFKSLIQFIISDIETWEIDSYLLFPKSLYLIVKNNKIENELFNIIFKHMILYMSSGAENMKNEYTYYFNKLIDYFSDEKSLKFPYKINNDIFELIISMGKFGQSPSNRRLSCYFSSCLCRILYKNDNNNVMKDENCQKLYQRLSYLFYDNEKIIENQLVRELQYIIPIFKDIMFTNEDVIKGIECYITLDSDHVIQCLAIETLIKNFIYISNQKKILNILFNKIKEVVESNEYEIIYKNNIMDVLINTLCKDYKNLTKIIKHILNIELINYFITLDDLENYAIFIKNFDKIFFLLNNNFESVIKNEANDNSNSDKSGNNNVGNNSDKKLKHLKINLKPENLISLDDLFAKIYVKLYNNTENSKCDENDSDSSCLNDNSVEGYNSEINTKDKENSNKVNLLNSNKQLLFLNLYKIIPCLLIIVKSNKQTLEILIDIFKKENIVNILKYYMNRNNDLNKTKYDVTKKESEFYKLIKLLIKNNYRAYFSLVKIFSNCFSNNSTTNHKSNFNIELINENSIFHNLSFIIWDNIFSSFQENPKNFSNDILLFIAQIFKLIIPKLYKYYRNIIILLPTKENPNNTNTNSNNDLKKISLSEKMYEDFFKNILSYIISSNNIGNHVKNEYMEILPYLLIYSKKRNDYLEYIRNTIINSNNFFFRRYSINFFKRCFELFSFNFIDKLNLYNDLLVLMSDKVNLISTNIIQLIQIYNKKIIIYSPQKFKDICKSLNKIYDLNIRNFLDDLKNFDREKNKIINQILNIINKNEKNANNNIFYSDEELLEVKEIENKLILNEKDINSFETNCEKSSKNIKNIIGSCLDNENINLISKMNLNSNNCFCNFKNNTDFSLNANYLNPFNLLFGFQNQNNDFKCPCCNKDNNLYKKGKTVKLFSNNKHLLPKLKGLKIKKDSFSNEKQIFNNINVIKPKEKVSNNSINNTKLENKEKNVSKNKIRTVPCGHYRVPSAKITKGNFSDQNTIINNNCGEAKKVNKGFENCSICNNISPKKAHRNSVEGRNVKGKSVSNKQIHMTLRPNSKTIRLRNDGSNSKIYINAEKANADNSICNK